MIGADIEHKEIPDSRPKLVLLYGEHSTSEELAARVGQRLKNSDLSFKTNLRLEKMPEGTDYVDAYEAVKKEISPRSLDFNLIYQHEVGRLGRVGQEFSHQIVEENQDALVVNLHATAQIALGTQRTDCDLMVGPNLTDEQLERLKTRITRCFPDTPNGGEVITVSRSRTVDPLTRKELPTPPNYVIIELGQDSQVYEKIAYLDKAKVGAWAQEAQLHRLKDPQAQSSPEEKVVLLAKMNWEVEKGVRILERVLPEVASFYQEEVLMKTG